MTELLPVLAVLAGAALWILAHRYALKRRAARRASQEPDLPTACRETCDVSDRTGRVVPYACSHDDREGFRIALWGEPRLQKRPEQDPAMCSACMLERIRAVSIRCASCGFSILPGDPVALCLGGVNGRQAWRTIVEGQMVLCLRWDCAAAPGFCGHWTGDRIQPFFPDGGSVISQAFKTGQPQLVDIGPRQPRVVDTGSPKAKIVDTSAAKPRIVNTGPVQPEVDPQVVLRKLKDPS